MSKDSKENPITRAASTMLDMGLIIAAAGLFIPMLLVIFDGKGTYEGRKSNVAKRTAQTRF